MHINLKILLNSAGTSLITLIVASGSQIARSRQMLDEEIGAAAKIKCQVNR
jgi:peptide subunit release factor 1 (eRF1)